ncbi:hypothetical protein [Paraburkholderia sp. WSM4175]|uniref:hypothetical protein n=1 Tax=Paraburkholderia sp. WSM4175 TaxID=2991072 RepID=UPI003D1EF9B0
MKLRGPAPELQHAALVIESVAGVAGRRRDEARASQRERRVVMGAVPAAAAVRQHDQRQVMACDRRVGRDGLGDVAQGVRRGRRIGGIPDSGSERRLGAIRYVDLLKADPGGEGRRARHHGKKKGDDGHQSHGFLHDCRRRAELRTARGYETKVQLNISGAGSIVVKRRALSTTKPARSSS